MVNDLLIALGGSARLAIVRAIATRYDKLAKTFRLRSCRSPMKAGFRSLSRSAFPTRCSMPSSDRSSLRTSRAKHSEIGADGIRLPKSRPPSPFLRPGQRLRQARSKRKPPGGSDCRNFNWPTAMRSSRARGSSVVGFPQPRRPRSRPAMSACLNVDSSHPSASRGCGGWLAKVAWR